MEIEIPYGPVLEVNVARRRGSDGAWNVEAIDSEGSIKQTIFVGPYAEIRARRYAVSEYAA